MAIQQCAHCGNEVEIPAEVSQLVNALGQPLCPGCFALWRQTHPATEEQPVAVRPSKYQFTPDMDEISGFGGGYEQICRNMLAAGLEWCDSHPTATPKFKGYNNIYGVIIEDNDDAKALSDAIVKASDGDCTGAMHHAVVSHCLWIRTHGWDAYCQNSKEKKEKEDGD